MDSTTIPDPGIYSQVPEENYFAWKGVSQSLLKELGKSFLHFSHALKSSGKKPSSGMRKGTGLHRAIWDLEGFKDKAARLPKGFTLAKNADKEEFARLSETLGEDWIFRAQEYDAIVGMAEEALKHKDVQTIVENVHPEHQELTFVDVDERLGLDWKLKGRADAVIPDLGWVLDIKTTTDASPGGFAKSIANYGYFLQAAHYVEGLRSMGAKSFKWIAIENEAPYAVGLYELTPEHFKIGQEYRDFLIRKLAHGIEKRLLGEHYTRGFNSLAIPKWALNDLEYELEQGVQ